MVWGLQVEGEDAGLDARSGGGAAHDLEEVFVRNDIGVGMSRKSRRKRSVSV